MVASLQESADIRSKGSKGNSDLPGGGCSVVNPHDLQLRIQRLNRIGIALSSEQNLDRLLEMIVAEARDITGADGCTLYLVEDDSLRFAVVETASLDFHRGGTGGEITWPTVPLYVEGTPNHQNVSAHVALTGQTVHLPDVYEAEGFDFQGTRAIDARTGYRSQSMLVVPMRDHEEQIIGVLQLLNALDSLTGGVVSFREEHLESIHSLASQAAVAINNAKLIANLEHLFEAFVTVMASAIDERSPATAGHIQRVAQLTLALANAVHESTRPPFADIELDEDELYQIRIAAWMHDVGKVTTPIHIIEKQSKLEGVFDRIHLVETRFDLIKATVRNQYLKRKVRLMEDGASLAGLRALDQEMAEQLAAVEADRALVVAANTPTEVMPVEQVERIQQIGAKRFSVDGKERPYLTPDEVTHLTVRKGNLTEAEHQIMRNHAAVSMRLLSQIPFPRKLQRVPVYAGRHHEKLNGTGYPDGLTADQLPLATRMLAIADVYEALTATDRSYKQGVRQEDALHILQAMADHGELDGDLVNLFVRTGIFRICGESGR